MVNEARLCEHSCGSQGTRRIAGNESKVGSNTRDDINCLASDSLWQVALANSVLLGMHRLPVDTTVSVNKTKNKRFIVIFKSAYRVFTLNLFPVTTR